MNIEGIDIKDIEFGEPIEEREPNYRDGYIRGIYRAKNIIDSKQKEIKRLNNIINEFNSSYYKIIKECEEMINDRYYMNENAIKYHANRIRDIAKYYVEEPKWQELKGSVGNETCNQEDNK